MPLYLSIAGFLFQSSSSFDNEGFGGWLRKKAERLLIPYFFWSLLGFIPHYFFDHGTLHGITFRFILHSCVYPRDGVWGHLWFLPMLFITYMIFGIIRGLANRKYEKQILVGIGIISVLFYFFPIRTNFLALSDVTQMMFFFYFGILINRWMNNNRTSFSKYTVIIILSCALAVIISWLLSNIASNQTVIRLAVSLLMISSCWALAGFATPNKETAFFSRHNLTFFLFSWFFQAVVMIVCDRYHLHWFITFTLMFSFGLSGPMIVVFLCRYLPFLRKHFLRLIIGER